MLGSILIIAVACAVILGAIICWVMRPITDEQFTDELLTMLTEEPDSESKRRPPRHK